MKFLILAILIFIGFIIYIRLIEMNSVFYPTKEITSTPADVGLSYEDITFQTSDNFNLNGWLMKGTSNTTILFFHGNGANISQRNNKLKMFHDFGLNVFIIDYRGYGKSEGRPSEVGVYRDAEAAYNYLLNRKDINQEKIIIYGESLGGAVATDLASKRKSLAVIMDSSFTSAVDIAKIIYPFIPSCLVGIKFDSVAKIASITVPKLFIQSQEDEIVPFKIGKKLYDTAPSPKEFLVVHGSHNEAFNVDRERFRQGIGQFLKKYHLQ